MVILTWLQWQGEHGDVNPGCSGGMRGGHLGAVMQCSTAVHVRDGKQDGLVRPGLAAAQWLLRYV